jgi:hypothetical protein
VQQQARPRRVTTACIHIYRFKQHAYQPWGRADQQTQITLCKVAGVYSVPPAEALSVGRVAAGGPKDVEIQMINCSLRHQKFRLQPQSLAIIIIIIILVY